MSSGHIQSFTLRVSRTLLDVDSTRRSPRGRRRSWARAQATVQPAPAPLAHSRSLTGLPVAAPRQTPPPSICSSGLLHVDVREDELRTALRPIGASLRGPAV